MWHRSWSKNRFGDTRLVEAGTFIYFIFLPSPLNAALASANCRRGEFVNRRWLFAALGYLSLENFRSDLWDFSLTLTERKRECWGKTGNRNHSMLEGNATSSREKKYKESLRYETFFVENVNRNQRRALSNRSMLHWGHRNTVLIQLNLKCRGDSHAGWLIAPFPESVQLNITETGN